MPRELTGHRVNGLNECICIEAIDPPGPGGANCEYRISGIKGPLDHHPILTIHIRFQNGSLRDVGANGITNEALVAVLIDRMEGFQGGPFANIANAVALEMFRAAQHALKSRTLERTSRGVEGTHQK